MNFSLVFGQIFSLACCLLVIGLCFMTAMAILASAGGISNGR